MIDEWYELELGEWHEIHPLQDVLRVPGGWVLHTLSNIKRRGVITELTSSSVFIPYIEKDKA